MQATSSLRRRGLGLLAACCTAAAAWCGPISAAGPHARDYLPADTLVYVSVTSVGELKTRFPETSLGRMLQDPALKPLVDKLWEAGLKAANQFQDKIGVPVEELLKLPQGEITLGVFPQNKKIVAALVWDVGEEKATADKLLARGLEAAKEEGFEVVEEPIEGQTATILKKGRQEFVYVWSDDALVIATQRDAAGAVLKGRSGGDRDVLATNSRFAALMKRCENGDGEPSQFEWFVDPIELMRTALQDNAGGQIALAALPVLGLDGLQGIGGTITFATASFDTIVHSHLLLDSTRSGILEALAMESGEFTPERWAPADLTQYTTVYWDVPKSYSVVGKMVDSFQGEGAFRKNVQKGLERFQIDLDADVLPLLGKRITYCAWTEPPVRLDSQSMLVALQIKDSKKLQELLDRVLAQFPDAYEKKAYAGADYYCFSQIRGPRQRALDRADRPDDENAAEPTRRGLTLCILGDRLLVADRPGVVEHVLSTSLEDKGGLAAALDFKLMSGRMLRAAGEQSVGLLTFNRPERELQFLYDLAQSDGAKNRIQRFAEGNDFGRDVAQSLEAHPLPPFETLKKYFAPSASMVTHDAIGFHYVNFVQRRKKDN